MCEIKLFRIYSKFFGGKIWLNLHIVFPDKIFDKKFTMVPLKFSANSEVDSILCKIFKEIIF